LRREIGRNLLLHKCCQDLTTCGHDLFTDDDEFRSKFMSDTRTCNGIVVRNNDVVDPFGTRRRDQFCRRGEGIL
jgi:hypothetical protein